MSENHENLEGQTLLGRIRVGKLLGAGGMGSVYAAEHVLTKKPGALKLLHRSYAALPDVVERFIREASAAGVIGNPHIVETYDAGKLATGEPYIFMERLHGTAVDELLRVRGRLRFDEAIEIVMQAAEGLEAAHAAGIVHRDIKPANLYLLTGDRPFVKLLDFGISKFASQYHDNANLTLEGRLLGTPHYMPPEQINGERDLDPRADVYSLGVVLYEMLAGCPPFNGETLMQLSVRIHQGKYDLLSTLRDDTPPGFDELIGRALAVRREDRFPSAQAFADALANSFRGRADSFAPTQVGESVAPRSDAAALKTDARRELDATERARLEAQETVIPSDAGSALGSVNSRLAGPGKVSPRRVVLALTLALALGGTALWIALSQGSEPELATAPLEERPSDSEPRNALRAEPTRESTMANPSPEGDGQASSNIIATLAPSASTEHKKPAPATTHPIAPRASTGSHIDSARRDGLSDENPFAE